MPHNRPALTRDFALLGLFVITLLVILTVWVVFESYQEHSRQVVNKLENEALRIDRALIVEIENAAYLLESIGRQIAQEGDSDEQSIAQLLQSFYAEDYSKSNMFTWSNKNQEVTVSSDRGVLARSIEISDRDYVKKAIAQPWQPHIGRAIYGRLSQRQIIPVSLGITDYDENYMGALVIGIDVENLYRRMKREVKEVGVQFAVTSKSFTLLSSEEEHVNFFTRNFDLNRLNKINVSLDPSGVYSSASLFGGDTIYAMYEVSSQYPFVIFAGYDRALNAIAISRILLPRFLQLIALIAFIVIILLMIRSNLSKPLMQLSRSAEVVLRGDTLQPGTLPRGTKEMAAIAVTIEKMSAYIAERRRIEHELLLKNQRLLKIRESAQLTNSVKADFLKEITQELQQPTISVLERAEAIKGQHFGPIANTKYIQQAEDIHNQSAVMLDLIHEIRTISDAETGLLALDEKPVDVAFIMQKCMRIFHDTPEHRDIEIKPKLAEKLPELIADELRFKQILLNMLHGAASKLDAGDKITVEAAIQRKEMVISVIFQPSSRIKGAKTSIKSFSAALNIHRHGKGNSSASSAYNDAQNNNHATNTPQGSGLGIILTRLLVALHEGTLDVRTRPGQGTEIQIRFPEKRIVKPA